MFFEHSIFYIYITYQLNTRMLIYSRFVELVELDDVLAVEVLEVVDVLAVEVLEVVDEDGELL